jgi:hypothetical protein
MPPRGINCVRLNQLVWIRECNKRPADSARPIQGDNVSDGPIGRQFE